jgi:hypothetical protein
MHVLSAVLHVPAACCRYKKLWDQDKDAYTRRYEKANKPLSSYELDIREYLNKEVRVCRGKVCKQMVWLIRNLL